jgi:hypothetical protein
VSINVTKLTSVFIPEKIWGYSGDQVVAVLVAVVAATAIGRSLTAGIFSDKKLRSILLIIADRFY